MSKKSKQAVAPESYANISHKATIGKPIASFYFIEFDSWDLGFLIGVNPQQFKVSQVAFNALCVFLHASNNFKALGVKLVHNHLFVGSNPLPPTDSTKHEITLHIGTHGMKFQFKSVSTAKSMAKSLLTLIPRNFLFRRESCIIVILKN